jgi:hypothetical protein
VKSPVKATNHLKVLKVVPFGSGTQNYQLSVGIFRTLFYQNEESLKNYVREVRSFTNKFH